MTHGGVVVSAAWVTACVVNKGTLVARARVPRTPGEVDEAIGRLFRETELKADRWTIAIARDLLHFRRGPARADNKTSALAPTGEALNSAIVSKARDGTCLRVGASTALLEDVWQARRFFGSALRSIGIATDPVSRMLPRVGGEYRIRHEWGVELIEVREGALYRSRRIRDDQDAWLPEVLQDAGDTSGAFTASYAVATVPGCIRLMPPSAQTRRRNRMRSVAAVAVVCAAIAGVAVLASGQNQKRTRLLIERERLAPLVEAALLERRSIATSEELAGEIAAAVHTRPAPLARLAELTALLPDSVFLESFEIRGDTLATISGWSPSATRVLALLERGRTAAAVRLIGTVGRERTGAGERFTIAVSWKS